MSEWREMSLGEALAVRHGFAFKGKYFRDEGELIVLTPGNFYDTGGFKAKSAKEKFYDGPIPGEYLLSRGDVVVAMTEQATGLLGSTATIPADDRYLHNQRLGLLRVTDPDKLDLRFCYHLFNGPTVRQQVQATATGSKVRHTAPERICAVRVTVPDLRTQRITAGILDALDDLIENNQRRIELLEQMTQAIYREWFVRFRYPGHQDTALVDSAVGPIPEGWELRPLVAVARLTMGQSPSSEHYNNDGIGKPFHQGVTDFGQHFPTHRKYCSVAGRSAFAGDALISVRAPVGRLNIACDELVIGRGLAAARSVTGRQAVLFWTLKELVFPKEDSMGGGTIFKAVGKKEVEQIPLLCAPERIEAALDGVLGDNLALIHSLTFASRELAAIRDLLLPKLVTGQIDVSELDLDGLVESVA